MHFELLVEDKSGQHCRLNPPPPPAPTPPTDWAHRAFEFA